MERRQFLSNQRTEPQETVRSNSQLRNAFGMKVADQTFPSRDTHISTTSKPHHQHNTNRKILSFNFECKINWRKIKGRDYV